MPLQGQAQSQQAHHYHQVCSRCWPNMRPSFSLVCKPSMSPTCMSPCTARHPLQMAPMSLRHLYPGFLQTAIIYTQLLEGVGPPACLLQFPIPSALFSHRTPHDLHVPSSPMHIHLFLATYLPTSHVHSQSNRTPTPCTSTSCPNSPYYTLT